MIAATPLAKPSSDVARRCLLCGGDKTQLVQRIGVSEIVRAYRAQLGVEVELPGDHLDYVLCRSCDLRFFAPVVTGSQQFYAQLQKIPWYYSAAKQEFGIAAQRITAADRVLEIGAGRGLFAREIEAASYVGLEFSAEAIRWAAQDGIELLPETVEQHAASNDGRYDVACAFQVLEHVADPCTFLRAAARCLRSGGRLMVSVPGEDSFARFAYQDVLNMPPHHVTRWTDAALRSIAAVCDMTLVAIVPEALGRNMRRAYANAHADRILSGLTGFEPSLLSSCVQRPALRPMVSAAAKLVRWYVSATSWQPRRGHAVVGCFEKP